MTRPQDKNLTPGPPNPSERKMPVGKPGAGWEFVNAAEAEDQRVLAEMDVGEMTPNQVLKAMMLEAGKVAVLSGRRYNRSRHTKEGPPKSLMEAMREARALVESVREVLALEGRAAEAETFWATLSERVQEAAPHMADGPAPIASVPA